MVTMLREPVSRLFSIFDFIISNNLANVECAADQSNCEPTLLEGVKFMVKENFKITETELWKTNPKQAYEDALKVEFAQSYAYDTVGMKLL